MLVNNRSGYASPLVGLSPGLINHPQNNPGVSWHDNSSLCTFPVDVRVVEIPHQDQSPVAEIKTLH